MFLLWWHFLRLFWYSPTFTYDEFRCFLSTHKRKKRAVCMYLYMYILLHYMCLYDRLLFKNRWFYRNNVNTGIPLYNYCISRHNIFYPKRSLIIDRRCFDYLLKKGLLEKRKEFYIEKRWNRISIYYVCLLELPSILRVLIIVSRSLRFYFSRFAFM